MNSQIRFVNWQWVFFAGLPFLLVLAAIPWIGSNLDWLTLLVLPPLGVLWLVSGLMIVANWRGGLDATIQRAQEGQRHLGKDPDTFNWEQRRKLWRAIGFALIVFGLACLAITIYFSLT